MSEPIWLRPVEQITYEELVAFLDEGVPESDHLEYKQPHIEPQSGKIEYTKEFLETVVAYANSGGGLIICGVGDKPEERLPITGVPPFQRSEKPMPPLDDSLRQVCYAKIEPTIYFDAHVIIIPDGEPNAGNRVLLVNVRPGQMPPYNHRDHGIWIRNYDGDQRATVAMIDALFARRTAQPTDQASYWRQILLDVFAPESLPNSSAHPCVMVGLTPTFPISHVEMDEEIDGHFSALGRRLAFSGRLVMRREPHGVIYMPRSTSSNDASYARAFDDGSIGVRLVAGGEHPVEDHPSWARHVALLEVRALMVQSLYAARHWMHAISPYRGPLSGRIAVGNLDRRFAVMHAPGDVSTLPRVASGEPSVNWFSGWGEPIDWISPLSADEVADRVMPSLARQMQYPDYRREFELTRELAT